MLRVGTYLPKCVDLLKQQRAVQAQCSTHRHQRFLKDRAAKLAHFLGLIEQFYSPEPYEKLDLGPAYELLLRFSSAWRHIRTETP